MTEEPMNVIPEEKPRERTNTWLRLSLVLNAISLLAVIILFFLVLGGKSNDEGPGKGQLAQIKTTSGQTTIAFVNSDRILEEYTLVANLRDNLEAESQKRKNDLDARQKKYEEDASYFQEQVQKQSISEEDAQVIYEKLMLEQQKLYDLKESYGDELARQEMDMNMLLLDSVTNFLKRYNTQFRFDYILGYNSNGNILLANDTLDLTDEVVEQLNREYSAKYPEPK
jgi:outer membrane protein